MNQTCTAAFFAAPRQFLKLTFCVLMLSLINVKGYTQTIFTTDFTTATFPPPVAAYAPVVAAASWTVTGSGISRVTSGTNPTCSPHSAGGMLRYNSYSISSGNASFISPVLNFTTAGTSYTVSFWMYRDNGYSGSADKLDVYVNTTNVAGGTLLGTVNRSRSLSPTVAVDGWYQYTYNIPTTYNTATNYLIFKFTSAWGNNCFVDDIVLTQNLLTPCTGTPTTTASGPANVCPSTAFTLSCTAVTGTGVTYQWKSATALVGPYSNIVGATSSTYTVAAGITSTTYYQVYTTCSNSGQNYTSNNLTVNVFPTWVCSVCASGATSTADEDIFNVTIGTLNNTSACSGTYSDYRLTVPAPTLTAGSPYTLSVNFNTCGGYYGRTGAVYIDYNHNGLFTDAGENVWTISNPTGVNSTSITIPGSATPGYGVMRVVYAEQGTAPPCGTFTWGETEDYVVNVFAPPCTGTPTTTASGPINVCPNVPFTISCTGIAGTGVTYQWKSASALAGPYSNIVGATNPSYTVASGINTTTYYQVYTTCSNSGLNYTSNNITVSVLPAYVCSYCTSTATSTADEEIFNVTLNTLNNTSNCASSNSMYTDYKPLGSLTNLFLGSTYPLSLTLSTCGGTYTRTASVWIDNNTDGVFQDPGERVYTVTTSAANPFLASGTVQIPGNSNFGITGMRVVYSETSSPIGPCVNYTWGETEDYLVTLAGIKATVTGSPFCSGGTVNVNYTAGGIVFNAGNVFTAQLSDATGSFLSPANIGTLTSTANSGTIVCTIPALQPGGSQYRIRVVSSNTAVTGSDNGTDLTINPTVVPSVSITVSPGTTICAGTNVTFNATPTNGGASPSYQWYVGLTPVGTNSPAYSTASLNNGDIVKVVMTSSAPCPSPITATSNTFTMTVNPLLTPTITISSVPLNTNVCVGQTVTFTAAITNGGPGPVYQWYKNGNPVGTNSNTYVDAVLNNNDNITCSVTSNATCLQVATVTSAPLVITVNPPVTPGVSISANPGNTSCAGSNVTFTATPVNGGPTPTYQWYVGATPVGTGATYSSTTLVTGDAVSCVLTSNAVCATPVTATSNIITMTVNPVVTPTISLATSPGTTICDGTNTTFSASVTNGGPTPNYVWTVNGNPAGSNSSTFSSNTLANGDVIVCTMTSTANCPNPPSMSASVTMTVNPVVVPGATAAVSPGTTICSGTLSTFTTAATNGGPSPFYQWYKNGIPVGGNNAVYTDNSLNNGDVLYCAVTSNAVCAIPATVNTNNITMIVNPTVVPGVSVSNNTGNTICAGTNVTFAASPLNGGNAPAYQWYLNGNPVGTNSAVYMNNSLNSGDAIYCSMTSNAVCATPATVSSTTTTMTVNPLSYPSVTITATPGDTICAGTITAFDAFPVNGGPSPSYTWYLNGNVVGTNSPTYTNNTLNNTDVVNVKMTSNAVCATPAVNYSNNIMMIVTGNITPTVVISGSSVICDGSLATFNAQITNGGNGPVYQWKVNGNPVGTNNPVYTDSTLANGDVVSVDMTSGFVCSTPPTVTATKTMTVNPVVTPGVSIVSTGDTICRNGSITFDATPVNGGPTPQYQWMKNGSPIGGPTSTFTYNNFNDSDVVSCNLVSSMPCPLPAIVGSNSKLLTVKEYMTPKVFINADPNVLICSGAPVVFNASVDSAGLPTDLSYQWMLNGNPVGTNAPSYTGNMLNNGDMVNYIMTSSALCLTKPVDTSKTDTVKWFNSGYLAGVTGTTESNTINLTNQNSNIRVGYVDCDLISSIKPTGANPVNGSAIFKVTIDPQVNSYGGHPYVTRHYVIEPQNNPSTATATIELYAYENEFRAYNDVAAAQWLPLLPTNKVDNGNTRITIFHGTGTAPGNYSGPTEEITPTVTWDVADNWWVMTFPATGFSGYYIHTGNFPLSVRNTAGTDGFSMTAFPNPVKDKVEVRLNGNRGANSTLIVTDLTGRTLINVEMDNNKAIIDMSGLASGMYMLRYSDDTRNETLKVTKQ